MRNVSLAHWECVKLGDTVPIPKCASIEHSFRVFLWHLAYPEIQAINIPSQLVVDGSHARPGDSSELVIYPPLIKCVNFPINIIFPLTCPLSEEDFPLTPLITRDSWSFGPALCESIWRVYLEETGNIRSHVTTHPKRIPLAIKPMAS
jgi:hypothetical protein